MHKIAVAFAALALAGCASLTSQERADQTAAIVAELSYRVEQLQALDLAKLETDPAVRVGADAACTFIVLGAPYLVKAVNAKLADVPVENQVSVDEIVSGIHAVCGLVRQIMVEKASAAPVEAPVPAPSPVGA